MALLDSLSLWLQSLVEQLEQRLQKKKKKGGVGGPLTNPRKREPVVCFYLAFSVPRALQQQAIKQNSFPLN